MSQENFERLGSTVVSLGNNFATTEAEIVSFGLRTAGAGALVGMAESEILAIGTALSSVGVEAERGGTAVQKVLLKINDSVATSNDKLGIFASTAGMSAESFAGAWRADPADAFAAFVEGLGSAGNRATTILSDLGLADQRLIGAFMSLANAGGLLRESIQLANGEWVTNTALTKEAEERFGTTASQMQIAINRINDAAIDLGNSMLPVIAEIADALADVVDLTGELLSWIPPDAVQSAIEGPIEAMERIKSELRSMRDPWVAAGAGSRDFAAAQDEAAESTDGMTDAVKDQARALQALKGAQGFLGIEGAHIAAQRAKQSLREARAEVAKLVSAGKAGTDEYRTAVLGARERGAVSRREPTRSR